MTTSVPQNSTQWRGLRVAVLGLGVTGFATADTLAELGSDVLVVAANADDDRVDVLGVIGVAFHKATDDEDAIAALTTFSPQIVVTSPGYRPDNPILRWVYASGIPLLGDIDVAWIVQDMAPKTPKWLCVTGTNGKTTTVQLATAMVNSGGLRAGACGNIGTPVLDLIRDPEGYDVLVVELSSFQLHYSDRVSAWASACLNIADDHIDWHGSREAYIGAKGKVYQRTQSVCVYNADEPITEDLVREADVVQGARAVGFTRNVPRVSMVGIVEDVLCDRAFLPEREYTAREIATLGDLETVGMRPDHLVSDVLAAATLALSVGVSPTDIRRAILEFHTDHHRIEPVTDSGGVLWIDDSKATNAHAANASLRAFDSVVWIVGGLLKGVDIGNLIESNRDRLRAAVVIGVDQKPVIESFARHAPDVPLRVVDPKQTEEVMITAVDEAARLAQPGDVVLLAPAAASMDQFHDYGARGDAFATAVRSRRKGGSDGDTASSGDDAEIG